MGMIEIYQERRGSGLRKAVENFKESLMYLKDDFEDLLDEFDEMGERGGSSGGSSGGNSGGGSYGNREDEDRYWRENEERMGERRGRRRRR